MGVREITKIDGGGFGDALVGWLLERAWEHRDDIIGTHHAISKAYEKHPEAFLK